MCDTAVIQKPVLDAQLRHAGELIHVGGDQGDIQTGSVRGDEGIERADGRAACFHVGANMTVCFGRTVVKVGDHKRQQTQRQGFGILFGVVTYAIPGNFKLPGIGHALLHALSYDLFRDGTLLRDTSQRYLWLR